MLFGNLRIRFLKLASLNVNNMEKIIKRKRNTINIDQCYNFQII